MKAKTEMFIRFGLLLLAYSFISIPLFLLPKKLFFRYKYPLFIKLYLLAVKIRVFNLTKKKIEQNSAVIYASNHKSFADFCFIAYFLRNPYTIMIKKEMTYNFFFKFLAWKVKLIPVDRNNPISQLEALSASIKIIKEDQYSLILFPEGWYHFDKPVGELKTGIKKIARETGAKVVPIAIYGIDNTFYKKDKLVWQNVFIKAGEPISYYDFKDRKNFLKTLESKIKSLYLEIEKEVKVSNEISSCS